MVGDTVPLEDPALAILVVARAVTTALRLDRARADALLGRHADQAGHALPDDGLLTRTTCQLDVSHAVIIFTYAGCALIRGGADRADAVAGDLGRFLGMSPAQLAVAAPTVASAAQNASRLDPPSAAHAFFEPDTRTKELAQRITQRLELHRDRKSIGHIAPATYEHPDDRKALESVRSVTGVETALRKLSEIGVEKIEAIDNLGNCIRVGPDQFPDLYALFCEVVEMLAMPRRPELFVKSMGLNAYTVGIERPRVVLSFSMPSLFTRDELLFVIGHELGHIRSGHAPFAQLRRILPVLTELVGDVTLGLGKLLGVGMQAALSDWYRKSELTCDRCGLLVAQNSDAALSALMKLAGAPVAFYRQMNLDAFVAQADDYDRLDVSTFSKLYKANLSVEQDHPWLSVRARELLRWVASGEYTRLLTAPVTVRCRQCGGPLADVDVFCGACGARRAI